MIKDERAQVVVVADVNPQLYSAARPEQPLFFHPGMAQQRLRRLGQGEPDRLLRVAGIQGGDVVIDATLGVGNDALVAAAGVGPDGRVIALEASWWLARLFAYAGEPESPWVEVVGRLLARIEIRIGDHAQLLAGFPSLSADVVLFDPMFRRPRQTQSDLDPARNFADDRPLSDRAWREAMRIARRCVVLKERPVSSEFARFGLRPDKLRAPFAFGVWRRVGQQHGK